MRVALLCLCALFACKKVAPPAETLLGGETGLDHVGIAVRDLSAARKTFHDGLGFGGMEAGKLPNGIENINYYFEDSTYLETLTDWDAQKAGWLADFLARQEGESFASLSIASTSQATAFLAARGIKMRTPVAGSIQTARDSGTWQTLFFEHSPLPADPIFFIAYPQPKRAENLAHLRDAIASGKIYKHPNGALGVKAVWLAVGDLDAAVKAFASIGLAAGADFREPRLGAAGRIIDAGQGKILLVAPAAQGGAVAAFLSARGGPGLLGLSIEVSLLGVAQGFVARFTGRPAPPGPGVLGESTWVSPAVAHGAWLEFFSAIHEDSTRFRYATVRSWRCPCGLRSSPRSSVHARTLALTLAAAMTSIAQAQTPATTAAPASPAMPAADADPYLWLEEIDSAKALDWVKARDADTVKEVASGPAFAREQAQILEVLDSDARIPYVQRLGPKLYNFWRDKENPRGIWRRATLAEYRKDKPKWETLIDVDALGKAEGVNWVWHGSACLKPDYQRCMVYLSRGGADAQVMRELDLTTRQFVKGGFELPEAKMDTAWIDLDTLYVATDFGPGSMTTSGYPRIVKEWKRGTPLASAKLVYEGKAEDLSISAYRDRTPGFERDFVQRAIEFFTSETYLRGKDGSLSLIDVPKDASVDVQREWILIQLRTDWAPSGKSFPGGSLLTAKFDDFMAGKRELTAIFTPTATTSLASHNWTRHHLILNTLQDVAGRIEVLTPGEGAWKREPLGGAPVLSSVMAFGADADNSDEYFVNTTGYLTPPTLLRGVFGKGPAKAIKHEPAFFSAANEEVQQFFATSKDGTRVPYFVISPKPLKLDGTNPTLLYGYGGFEISLEPDYSGTRGRAWLKRGGVYVVANIRGGGEYGPQWHQAALKQNRPRAYEDFAAVAQDLVARKITSKEHLGTMGGSNGGLLMGNMLTLYPELFAAIVCQVPLLDMKRYTHLSAGASWIAEYGDPDKPEEWAYLQTFSPYQNLKAGVKYPPILFTTSTRDDRVGPVHARKMAAKMLAMGLDAHLYENVEGGHGAAADNKQLAFMSALAYEFLWNHVK